MIYKTLSRDEKIRLLSKINWDYIDTPEDMLDVIEDKKITSGAFTKQTLFVRSLETLSWNDLVNLWTLEKCIILYNNKVRRMIFDKFLRGEYDKIFTLLRTGTLPHAERSPEDIKRIRASFLSNRRNRRKQRVSKS